MRVIRQGMKGFFKLFELREQKLALPLAIGINMGMIFFIQQGLVLRMKEEKQHQMQVPVAEGFLVETSETKPNEPSKGGGQGSGLAEAMAETPNLQDVRSSLPTSNPVSDLLKTREISAASISITNKTAITHLPSSQGHSIAERVHAVAALNTANGTGSGRGELGAGSGAGAGSGTGALDGLGLGNANGKAGLIVDISGSMLVHATRVKEEMAQYQGAEIIEIENSEVGLDIYKAFLKLDSKVNTIILITDLQDPSPDQKQILERVTKICRRKGIVWHVVVFSPTGVEDDFPLIHAAVEETKGQLKIIQTESRGL